MYILDAFNNRLLDFTIIIIIIIIIISVNLMHTVWTLIRRRVLRRLIWVCTECLYLFRDARFNRTSDKILQDWAAITRCIRAIVIIVEVLPFGHWATFFKNTAHGCVSLVGTFHAMDILHQLVVVVVLLF